MASDNSTGDPLAFVRNMWGNMGFSLPGMVTPTLDVDEIEKRITDLKAVENWLRMNLSMLQVTIQSMEMQKSTLTAMQAMSQMVTQPQEGAGAAGETAGDAMSQAAMWPWTVMQKMQAQMQEAAAQSAAQQQSAVEQAQKSAGGRRKKSEQ